MRLSTTFAWTNSLLPKLLSMSHRTNGKKEWHPRGDRRRSLPSHRRRPLRALFVHLDEEVIDACRQELEAGQFTVQSDFTLNLEQCAEQARLQPYDVMVVEYPSPACKEAQMLQLIVNARTVTGQTNGCSPFGVSVSGTPVNVSSVSVNLCH